MAAIQDFPVERWDAIIAINLSATFHAMRVALPGMQKRNWGRIINVASTHGLVASVQKSAYVAAKHGVVGLTKVAALENATTGITVNAICPGWVLTPLVQKQVDARAAADGIDNEAAKRALLGEKQPSMQFTTPEQLAELAVFMCLTRRRQRARRGLADGRRLDGSVAGPPPKRPAAASPSRGPRGRTGGAGSAASGLPTLPTAARCR